MSKKFNRNTITAALPYANGPLHIGHMAGCYIPADIYARYLRMRGEDVAFICGSDEHGVAITIKARNENITPQQVVDRYHEMIKKSFEEFGISFDIYSRTSEKIHHETASEFFLNLHEKGEFIEGETDQYFDEQANLFLADRYIEGTCPKCGNERAYGDQCENCGSSLSPMDLINPVSKLSGSKPVLRKTKQWYLALDRYGDWLKQWILVDHKDDWKNNVLGQCRSWLEAGEGLQPRSMTRDMDWGVPVPKEIPGSEGKVLYVWFDAPIGYISATKEWAINNGKNWEDYWKSEDCRLIHFIGKDNIVFHCIIFPSILKAQGGYILPTNVPANEFLNLEGQKISTSRNWAVWLHEYLADFPGKQDVLRYVLTANAPESKDNDFTWKDFQTRNNSELVAIYANFANRVMVLMNKYFEGVVPIRSNWYENDTTDHGILSSKLNQELSQICRRIQLKINQFKFRDAISDWLELARNGNRYLTEMEPWKKFIPNDRENPNSIVAAKSLVFCLDVLGMLAVFGSPFLPDASKKLSKMLNLYIPKALRFDPEIDELIYCGKFEKGLQLGVPVHLFQKIEDDQIEKQIEKLKSIRPVETNNQEKQTEAQKPNISFDDFKKLDIRIGTVLEAELVPKTDKLLKILLDIGGERRTVVSGIAGSIAPEEIIGKQVTYLANLEPRTIRGIESNGMILMVENSDGKLHLLNTGQSVVNGSGVS